MVIFKSSTGMMLSTCRSPWDRLFRRTLRASCSSRCIRVYPERPLMVLKTARFRTNSLSTLRPFRNYNCKQHGPCTSCSKAYILIPSQRKQSLKHNCSLIPFIHCISIRCDSTKAPICDKRVCKSTASRASDAWGVYKPDFCTSNKSLK